MTTTRLLNNAGSPIVDVAGNVLSGAVVTFALVDTQGVATDTFDSTTFERIYGSTTATTDPSGILSVYLWPNDRGTSSTMYLCSVDHPGIARFVGFMTTGAVPMSWYSFRNQTVSYTPPQATALDAHINNVGNPHATTKAQVGLGSVDNTADADKPVSTAQAAAMVPKTTGTGSAILPAGTTAQRDGTPLAGYTRFNSTLNQWEGYNGTTWTALGGGATGGAGNYVFMENDQNVTVNYTLTAGKNAVTAGPVTINSGVTVTIGSGQTWVIV
jgi:hypothetical protein